MPADGLPHFFICEVQKMDRFRVFRLISPHKGFRLVGILTALMAALSLSALPAAAHHPMGGKMPSNFFEGFLSGVAHPLLGPDHFAFVVAVGLLAATKQQGFLVPLSFMLSAMLGTGAHLAGISLPGVELLISASILLFGILLAIKDSPHMGIVSGLSAVAGLFHGYAYGEAIFGAEMTPVLAYLIGFTAIQLAVSLVALQVGKAVLRRRAAEQPQIPAKLRSAGFVICGVGLSLLTSQVIATIFPVPGG